MASHKTIGIIGLGVMGSALAQNLARNDFAVSIYNRTPEKTEKFVKKYGNKNFAAFSDLQKFIESLEKPRRIILMIQAGKAVDQTLEQLEPLLEKGDGIMDGGNSFYKDTENRQKKLEKKGIHFLGTGISGGEKGALEGPSIMPGGPKEVWKLFQEPLEKIAARDFSGKPCVAYLGEGGSGHYVKMVHNGIEYAMLQLISEAYSLLKNCAQHDNQKIGKIFTEWNNGRLNGYLIESTAKIFEKGNLIDDILDTTGQKGTGIWTTQEALENGIPVNTIAEATFARFLSSQKENRRQLAKKFPKKILTKNSLQKNFDQKMLEDALCNAFLLVYAQGFSLLEEFDRNQISHIWQGGCIIRSRILGETEKIFSFDIQTENLRQVIKTAIESAQPVPAFSSTLQYFEMKTTDPLGTNLIQALRDFFGAHGFQKKNEPGIFHGDWHEKK